MTPENTTAQLQAALVHHQAGRLQDALNIYAQVLQVEPQNADAWHLVGLAAFALGDTVHAEASIRRAIQLKPGEATFAANLAALLVQQQRNEEAETLCRNVLQHSPKNADALTHLGTALRQQNQLQEAERCFAAAVHERPNGAGFCNLGTVLADLGRVDEARAALEQARELAPELAQVHINLGAVLRELGDRQAALEALNAAEALVPNSYEVFVNRGNLFVEAGQVLDGVEQYQQAIAIDSSNPSAVSGLGRALQLSGAWEESLEAQRLAAELNPDNQKNQSSYLYAVTLSPLLTPRAVAQRHADWGRRLESQVRPFDRYANDINLGRRLRIGYVSPDLRSHATMRFLFPLLQNHDRSRVEVFFYSETTTEDSTTEAVRQLSNGWCATRGLSDDQLCEQIRSDRIDVLIDLAGHTAGNRLPVFARKPAPIQVSFLGYPNTTGLSRIDYFLTDQIREPEVNETADESGLFTEQPILMPHGACVYSAINAPDVSPAPMLKKERITFGSTHRLEKISPQTVKLWGWVLSSVPNSRLFVFRDCLESESLRGQLKDMLQEGGVNTGRVDFAWQMPDEYLDLYANIDIMLDVFPWGSGTIAYDAMWMGVPIPTLKGDRGGCRATASMLHFCGLDDLIAESSDEYVQIVADLAADADRLQSLRNSLRERMAQTVCNGPLFAQDLEAAVEKMWKSWVAQSATERSGAA
ncbi:MAG: tetratricopeptide repeat protein [Fuerstiella sp.]